MIYEGGCHPGLKPHGVRNWEVAEVENFHLRYRQGKGSLALTGLQKNQKRILPLELTNTSIKTARAIISMLTDKYGSQQPMINVRISLRMQCRAGSM